MSPQSHVIDSCLQVRSHNFCAISSSLPLEEHLERAASLYAETNRKQLQTERSSVSYSSVWVSPRRLDSAFLFVTSVDFYVINPLIRRSLVTRLLLQSAYRKVLGKILNTKLIFYLFGGGGGTSDTSVWMCLWMKEWRFVLQVTRTMNVVLVFLFSQFDRHIGKRGQCVQSWDKEHNKGLSNNEHDWMLFKEILGLFTCNIFQSRSPVMAPLRRKGLSELPEQEF